eukprot:gnl/Spiro4/18170_TR9702_c0_g2_i1.p1 gnl/Spiro4/18170_TR9702_c0_g2~~gnl/Spiro4/18170_TR9702_c0_g2_i1.p1  ORF type:complete len:346 (+),score=28.31 gnl/Spiro4/18170_TR9702_c0_g2_i1:28-1065(+)
MDIQSLGLLEKDLQGECSLVWSFPSLDNLQRPCLSRCLLAQTNPPRFCFTRYGAVWLYSFNCPTPARSSCSTTAFSVCLVSKNYDPEKYEALLAILARQYLQNGSPLKILEIYLRLATNGSISGEVSFSLADWDPRRPLLAGDLREVVRTLGGANTVLLWAALLLKKRVAVFNDDLSGLLAFVRVLPCLVWHRQNWAILRPYVTMDPVDLEDLAEAGVYCAGFIDRTCRSAADSLYDVLVDISEKSVTISELVKGEFLVGPFHKNLANILDAEVAATHADHQPLIKVVAFETRRLLDHVAGLRVPHGDGTYVTRADLETRNLPAGMPRFLFACAQAEGWTSAVKV